MLNVTIICIGKLKEQYLRDACNEYIKRLSSFCRIKIVELSPSFLNEQASQAQIKSALEDEGRRIVGKISKDSRIYAMCIEGTQRSSQELSAEIDKIAVNGTSNVTFIIGGSFGISEDVKEKANFKLSMSKMTFPHQLVRVMLLEQIYRAFNISTGGKYHK